MPAELPDELVATDSDAYALLMQEETEPPLPENHGWKVEVNLFASDLQTLFSAQPNEVPCLLASVAKRQRSEVRMTELTHEERDQFAKAKKQEVHQWLNTETVQKIARHQIPESQILRSRWVLTWKPPDPCDASSVKKAKARLVVLGYEDPQVESIPRGSPTVSRDSRMLALQLIAAKQWTVRSFDIKTAFLRGSRRDSRISWDGTASRNA